MATFWEIAARSVGHIFPLSFVYLYFLFISHFGFKSGIWLLIAPVPVHCFSITFNHDMGSNLERALNRSHRQTDVIIIDFAEAFDMVPHRRLLLLYGIRGFCQNWNSSRIQSLPQVPVLFLVFINDIRKNIRSSVRLFADDCVLYRNIKSQKDCQVLQDT